MIGRWPAYSWIVTVPASVTLSVTANGVTQNLVFPAGAYRGLGSSNTLMAALTACLDTHTQIGGASLAYNWEDSVAEAIITLTTTTGPVVINSATNFTLSRLGLYNGVSFGSVLTTTQIVRAYVWDGLWSVYGSHDVDYRREFAANRTASRFSSTARTQVSLAETITTQDRHLLVAGRYIDPRFAAMVAYATAAGTNVALIYGTIAGLMNAQLSGQRDIGPNITTVPWLWRHVDDTDLAGTSIDIILPQGSFNLDALAQKSGGGGRRYSVSITWQETP